MRAATYHQFAKGGRLTPDPRGEARGTGPQVAAHTEAMRDGNRDHRETIAIANKARPVVAEYQSIISEADHIRGLPAHSQVN